MRKCWPACKTRDARKDGWRKDDKLKERERETEDGGDKVISHTAMRAAAD